MSRTFSLGDRASFSSALCTVRFIGPVKGTEGEWLGVEWDDPKRGKHNGTRDGITYFKCWNPSPTAGSFVRPTRKSDPERTFVEAVYQKYATEYTSQPNVIPLDREVIISGKVAEEIGFDKIREQQARLNELKIIIVDGLQIKHAEKSGESIKETCPSVVELDLSRNIFGSFEDVANICKNLQRLKKLRLNGNRFSELANHKSWPPPEAYQSVFSKVTELEMDENFLPWPAMAMVRNFFPSLIAFEASSNGFTELSNLNPPFSLIHQTQSNFSLTDSLKTLTLEYNEFESFKELIPLQPLALESLRLKGNKISKIGDFENCKITPVTTFSSTIRYLDISYNMVDSWSFVDNLLKLFPGLTSLRFSHNPIYEKASNDKDAAGRNDDGFMLTIARIKTLIILNFSNITPVERTNAEMYYLSKIAKEIGEVPKEEEGTVITRHPRFKELCEIYGSPTIARKRIGEVNPKFLEARLIKFACHYSDAESQDVKQTIEIPKSCDIYRVKGLIGKLFRLPPWKLRLVHETGEWDPVAGYEEDELDSEGEEETRPINAEEIAIKERGRWMKREVEIEDSTRQVGNFIDGLEAILRIEIRS